MSRPRSPARSLPMTDRALPMAFLLFASFTGVLVWMIALLNQLPIR